MCWAGCGPYISRAQFLGAGCGVWPLPLRPERAFSAGTDFWYNPLSLRCSLCFDGRCFVRSTIFAYTFCMPWTCVRRDSPDYAPCVVCCVFALHQHFFAAAAGFLRYVSTGRRYPGLTRFYTVYLLSSCGGRACVCFWERGMYLAEIRSPIKATEIGNRLLIRHWIFAYILDWDIMTNHMR